MVRRTFKNSEIMEENKLIAKVKFNDGIALVFENPIQLTYKREGNLMYGTNGLFYDVLVREPGTTKAFAGRKFDITLESGEMVHCVGDWWYAGSGIVADKLGISLLQATASDIKKLIKCYVFNGYMADSEKLNKLLSENDLPVYDYWDYEKIIKYDSERKYWINKCLKLERDKTNIIAQIKLKKHKL